MPDTQYFTNIDGKYVKDAEARQQLNDLEDYVENIAPVSLSVTENGTYTAPTGVFGYSPVTVDTGIYTGTTTPTSALGKNGDYYYKVTDTKGAMSFVNINESNTAQIGYSFYSDVDISIDSFCGYTRNSNVDISFVLLDEQLNVIHETPTFKSVLGWSVYSLSEPITLSANTTYSVLLRMSSAVGGYATKTSSQSNFGTFHPVKGIYYYNGSYGYDNNNLYTADVMFKLGYNRIDKQYFKQSGLWVEIDV